MCLVWTFLKLAFPPILTATHSNSPSISTPSKLTSFFIFADSNDKLPPINALSPEYSMDLIFLDSINVKSPLITVDEKNTSPKNVEDSKWIFLETRTLSNLTPFLIMANARNILPSTKVLSIGDFI